MNGVIQKIKEKLSIVDVLSSYLKVEKAGKNYKARCPFHNEKTPSFFISPERESYYCFGCHAKGDIFSFVENFEGTDFPGALKILADRAGIPLEYDKKENNTQNQRYYKIMEEASLFYEKQLSLSKEALSYLNKRGLSDKTIKDFRIGYSKDEWNLLENYLSKKGYKKEEIETVGLIKKNNKGTGYYDRFRSRIMFPISDSAGRVVAFSGRIFKNPDSKNNIEEAKYINSPDTPLYNKSDILFGLDKAKKTIKERNYCIVVEGQMDLILSHQMGFTNTVAVSGTAFADSVTDENSKINNLGLIKRLSSNVIFAFDGDSAGLRAAYRSAMIALSLDMQVKVAFISGGKDPSDIILEDKELWKKIIKDSKDVISFSLQQICEKSSNKEERRRLLEEKVFPFMSMINSSIKKSNYIKEIYESTGIFEDSILKDFNNFEKKTKGVSQQKNNKSTEGSTRKENLIKSFFSIVFWGGSKDEEKDHILKIKEDFISKVGKDDYNLLEEKYKPFLESLVFEAERLYTSRVCDYKKDLEEIVLNLEEELLNEKAYLLFIKIKEAENKGQRDKINNDLLDYQKLVEKIEIIKSNRLK